jgi:hypothetical protein
MASLLKNSVKQHFVYHNSNGNQLHRMLHPKTCSVACRHAVRCAAARREVLSLLAATLPQLAVLELLADAVPNAAQATAAAVEAPPRDPTFYARWPYATPADIIPYIEAVSLQMVDFFCIWPWHWQQLPSLRLLWAGNSWRRCLSEDHRHVHQPSIQPTMLVLLSQYRLSHTVCVCRKLCGVTRSQCSMLWTPSASTTRE